MSTAAPWACLAAAVLLSCDEAALAPVLEEHTAIVEAKAVDLHAGMVDEEPLPIGFDRESWREYLLEKISTGQRVNIGGVEVIVAEMDEPLSYEGDYPSVEMVPVSAEELELAGASPGDELPGSTPLNRRLYVLDSDDTNYPVDYTGEPRQWSFWFVDMWHPFWGAGLAFGKNSGIEVTGCRATLGTLGTHQGEAFFHGPFTGLPGFVQLRLPNRSCIFSLFVGHQRVSTWYAIGVSVNWFPGDIIWLVYEPETWKMAGTDAWKHISLAAGEQLGRDRIHIHGVHVTHNGRAITNPDMVSFFPPLYELNAPPDRMNIEQMVGDYKRSLTMLDTISSPVLAKGVDDYSQTASTKYSVFTKGETWFGMKLPYAWCSQFSSWLLRQSAPQDMQEGIPVPTSQQKNIGVADMFDWANMYPERLRFFGRNHPQFIYNGASNREWAALQHWVKQGDYIARWHEVREDVEKDGDSSDGDVDPSGDYKVSETGHSMIFVGWLSDDGTSVGPQYFDPLRPCNRMWALGGNELAPGVKNSGLGGIVNLRRRVVCQRPNLENSGAPILGEDHFWEDPPYPICPWECDIRLYDTRPFPWSLDLKAGFIVSTQP